MNNGEKIVEFYCKPARAALRDAVINDDLFADKWKDADWNAILSPAAAGYEWVTWPDLMTFRNPFTGEKYEKTVYRSFQLEKAA